MERGMDVFVAVDDARAEEAVRALAADGIVSGESGAAGVAGLLELCDPEPADGTPRPERAASVLVISTEGATDPVAWERIVGYEPPAARGGEG
jgi:diaminopropionate ammonia-lyase